MGTRIDEYVKIKALYVKIKALYVKIKSLYIKMKALYVKINVIVKDRTIKWVRTRDYDTCCICTKSFVKCRAITRYQKGLCLLHPNHVGKCQRY